MRRSRPQRCRRTVLLGAAAAALHHTAADAAATTAAYESGESTANGRGLVGAATTPRHVGESPYKGRSAYGFFDVGENCLQSPHWDREVDENSYELGCEEIEVSVVRARLGSAVGYAVHTLLAGTLANSLK